VSGLVDLRDEGYGFLRLRSYLPSRDDSYVPVKLARQYGLRKGDHVTGLSRPPGRHEKNPAMLEIHTVNGADPELARHRPRFDDLTALFPDERLKLEMVNDPYNMTARIIDLMSPIGKGQRGIIVSPPKAGKTSVMKTIAQAIEANHPEVELIVLLVDERPEEVTDMRRSVRGEVVASTFDRPSEEHTQVAEMVIEKAKRSVEQGRDVVLIVDGITRLTRAYNLAAPPSGRILSGGIDAGELYPPK
jgi:transcription termination factor Rho